MNIRSVAPGVMPGTAALRAFQLLESELPDPHIPALAELPGRGHHASLLGRAIAQLSELYAELTSYGWRLVQRPGADYHRATRLLSTDVNTLSDVRGTRAEAGHEAHRALKLEVLGPVSLSAQLALASGEKILADHGARRDLAASLATGLAGHLEHIHRVVAPQKLTVVLLEPDYRRVRAGEVPTVSGYKTLRALPRDEARDLIGVVVGSLRTAGADHILLDLSIPPEPEHREDFFTISGTRVDGFGLPVPRLSPVDWERAAGLVEDGALFAASVLGSDEQPRPDEPLPQTTDLCSRLTRPWAALGMPLQSLAAFSLAGYDLRDRMRMASFSETEAMRTITRVRDTAEALTDQIRSA